MERKPEVEGHESRAPSEEPMDQSYITPSSCSQPELVQAAFHALCNVACQGSGEIPSAYTAILVAAGVVLYPNGWSSVEVQQACGNLSRAYALGTCKMSWSYYITIGGSLLTFLCSGLSYNAARTKNVHYGI
ncbi:hypothetical protein Bbelb_233710 [Branchiostoma belcheri]|nr:hypothetical protein Bbelb_233710 [Branchiostoma belcheri]